MPVTVIISDCWKSYNRLQNQQFLQAHLSRPWKRPAYAEHWKTAEVSAVNRT
jgi:hypothetical protein